MSNPSSHDTAGAPALSQELNKAEARQASNLRVTTKAIDALYARIAKAKLTLDNQQQQQGGASRPVAVGSSPSRSGTRGAASGKSPTRSPTRSPTKSSASKSPSKGKDSASSKTSPVGRKSTARSTSTAAAAAEGAPQAMELESGETDGGGGGVLAELASDVAGMKTLEAVASENKNFHATISKLAKAAEKHFGGDVESVRRRPPLNEKALHTAIITHLYRKGAFRAAAKFSEDSAASIPPDTSSQLVEMHGVFEALDKQNLGPAERWFEKRRTALEGVGSTLEFQLARLRFLRFLKSADPQQMREAMLYARQRLRPVARGHDREFQELMGSLVFSGNLETSPYSHLLSPSLWARAKESVAVDGSRVSGLSRESVLSVAFRAGVLALPTLIKMAAVVRGSNQEWDGMQELPLEVPLPAGLRYHSMFSCPVTREPSTMDNPPVLLKCGHAVLRSSVSRLARNGSRETTDLPRFEQHGFVSRHVSEKGLEAAWHARKRYHDMHGRPRHSKKVLEWNGQYVLYDLHLPPGASLPISATSSTNSSQGGSLSGGSSERDWSLEESECAGPSLQQQVKAIQRLPATTTSVCRSGSVFRSNGGLVSPNERYTFVQHNDNELVIYDAEGGIIWSCPGAAPVDVRKATPEDMNTVYTEFQHDGTLVQYHEKKKGWGGRNREELWRSHLVGGSGAAGGDRLVLQDDGNLVIYNSKTSAVVWDSGTGEHGGPNRIVQG
eukprot:g18728.t1